MDLHALQPGYLLSEYRIEKLLGEGGFGLTYLAFDTNLEKKVAIKEYMPSEFSVRKDGTSIVPKSNSNKEIYEWGLNSFINEAKTLAKFETPNIVRIYRFFEANGSAYIVMEHCDGGCLNDYLSKDKFMKEAQVKEILVPIMKCLKLVHNAGVLHRDIKPENIMFRLDGTPVLIDFGAARQAIGTKSRHLTKIYTPGYAPMEQYSSEGNVGPWSDIYSLAAVAYICLTGKRPDDILNRITDDPIEKLGNRFGATEFLKSIDKALNVQVEDRPKDIDEWLQLFEKDISLREIETAATVHMSQSRPLPPLQTRNSIKQPISAKSEVSIRDMGSIVTNTSDYSYIHNRNLDNSGNKIVKFLLLLILLGGLSYAGYILFLQYKEQQTNKIITQETTKSLETKPKIDPLVLENQKQQLQQQEQQKEQQKLQQELITKIQRQLKNLKYDVSSTGILDSKTIESIKDFESKNNLIVAGVANPLVLKQLTERYQIEDDKAWQTALNLNTQESYIDYKYYHPNGKYLEQAQTNWDNVIEAQKNMAAENDSTNSESYFDNESSNPVEADNLLISQIQRELKRIKFNKIEITGRQDPLTTKAIKAYNKVKGQSQTATPTLELLNQLSLENQWPGLKAGETFSDCTVCPEMVVIPAGDFQMGSNNGKEHELPVHTVNIEEFNMSVTEITFAQWDACVNAGGCRHFPDSGELSRQNHPVMRVNWYDAQEYVQWLKANTGKNYRLPTEAEWEYATRAGTTTEYYWGDQIDTNKIQCLSCSQEILTETNLLEVKSFPANPFGLYDTLGGVWEWTEDCWHSNYNGAPTDGSAWEDPDCRTHVVRSASGINSAEEFRSANRGTTSSTDRLNSLGFRIALDL